MKRSLLILVLLLLGAAGTAMAQVQYSVANYMR